MYENSIAHVKDCNSIGLDKLPVSSIILNEATGDLFYWPSNSSANVLDIFEDGSCKAIYQFEGNVNDTSGTYNGTATNVTYTAGKFGSAVSINGTGSSITLPMTVITSGTVNNSISIWFYKTSIPSSDGESIWTVNTSGSVSGSITLYNSLQVAFWLWNNGWIGIASTDLFALNAWNHVVCVNDNGTLRLYLNSIYQGSAYAGAWRNPIDSTYLGKNGPNGPQYPYTGLLDECRIFNKALSQTEATTLFNEDFMNTKFCDIPKKILFANNGRLLRSGLFYGGDDIAVISTTTLLSSTATLVQAETNVGTSRGYFAGANVGINALFYAGDDGPVLNITTLLSPTATLVQSETNVGTARSNLAGANVGTNALFYGGYTSSGFAATATLISSTATLVQAETPVIETRSYLTGTNVGTNALFYGGWISGYPLSTATLLSPTAVLVQAETDVGTDRGYLAGANVGTNALFYGGYSGSVLNTTTLLSPTAVLVQAETNVGTNIDELAGANVGTNALFYGGGDYSGAAVSTAALLSPTATLVQAETSVGTARYCLAGASV